MQANRRELVAAFAALGLAPAIAVRAAAQAAPAGVTLGKP